MIFETQQLVSSQEALRLLKEGNARFVSDTAVAGNITEEMRQSLVKDRKWTRSFFLNQKSVPATIFQKFFS